MKNPKPIAAAVLVFAGCLFVGFWIAGHRILWNDERWTLTNSVLGLSYLDILRGRIGEGNNSPLFYILQKLQCAVFAYQPPMDWPWEGKHLFSQVFLRVQPVVSMSLAVSVLFYYFAVNSSLLAGLYSVAVALSSFMLWDHWAEARPYALWFLLTTLQMLLLTDLLRSRNKNWGGLALVHGLLALTTSIGMVQIAAASLALWLFSERKWRSYITMAAVPLAIGLFYYFSAPKYNFCFVDGPVALINANIPKDRMAIAVIFALALAFGRKKDQPLPPEGRYLVFMAVMLACFALVLLRLKMTASSSGFQVSNRYFMPLTSVGIMGTTLFSIWLVQQPKSKLFKMTVIGMLAAFLIFRIYRVLPFIHSSLYVNGIR